MKSKPDHGRKTIGVLIDWTVDAYQHAFLSGVMDLARSRGVNCIVFEGGGVGSPFEFETQRNGIYRLASAKVVDGLIVLSASIAYFIGAAETKAFCENYLPMPLVSISMEIENAISVLVDNRPGMRELVTHLIERHPYRKFGFIKGRAGNQDAEDRFNVFLEVLRERNIHVNAKRVFQGDFTFNSGIEAAKYYIKRGVSDVDVIVASNDTMAMGLMQELNRRGVRIPGQVAVTGFDDIDFGDYLFPPLSTVRLPIYEQGATAAKLLIDSLGHKEVPTKVYVPTRMVIRESCGCHSGYPASSESPDHGRRTHPVPVLREKEDTLPYLREFTQLLLANRTELNPDDLARTLDLAWGKGGDGGDPAGLATAFYQAVYDPLHTSIDFFT
jgi:DNA-binding LacI/PurR family transcriptional regulator